VSAKPALYHASLNIVRPELTRLIRQVQADYGSAVQSAGEDEELRSCVARMRQADGVLRLIELADAALLASDVADAMAAMPRPEATALETVTRALHTLVRYLDYLGRFPRALPELMIEQCNALRALHGGTPLAETCFLPDCAVTHCLCPDFAPVEPDTGALELVRRLRHLYQIGLLGVLRGHPDPVHMRMMQRATERMLGVTGGGPRGEFWWLMSAILEGFAGGYLLPGAPRRQMLARGERMFRSYIRGEAAAAALGDALREELLALVTRTRDGARARQILDSAGIEGSAATDTELAAAREGMLGESAEEIAALSARLQGEFQKLREELERLSAQGNAGTAALEQVGAALAGIVRELDVGGVPQAAHALRGELAEIEARIARGTSIDRSGMHGIADAVIEAEAALAARARGAVALRATDAATTPAARHGMLDEARAALLQNARDCLEAVKRDIAAYADTRFDGQLLAGAVEPLEAVRGGLSILEHPRAAAVAADMAATLRRIRAGTDSVAIDRQADLLADVLICLEYYLSALANGEAPDPMVLGLAEQSLAALQAAA